MATHTYQLIPTFLTGGQFAQSVWHYAFDDVGFLTTKDAATALISAWDTAHRTQLRACLPTDVTIVSYRARQINAAGGFNAYLPISATNAGTRTGTQSATGLCPVVIFFPINPADGRGKWFIPGVSEADIEDGRFTDTYSSAINTILTSLFDPVVLTGGGGPTASFGWFSKVGNTMKLPNIALLSQNLGTQRRRMRPAG